MMGVGETTVTSVIHSHIAELKERVQRVPSITFRISQSLLRGHVDVRRGLWLSFPIVVVVMMVVLRMALGQSKGGLGLLITAIIVMMVVVMVLRVPRLHFFHRL